MADLVPIPDEFDDANDFWKHPIYDNYEANRNGVVRNVKHKKELGKLTNTGYLRIDAYDKGKAKTYLKHRFIYECFFGLITDPKLVIDHKNNIKTDNRLQNLQLISQSQNLKKENRKGENLPPIQLRAININSGVTSVYNSINKCCKDLDINIGSIMRILDGTFNSATSKKDKNKYTFEKLNCETDTSSIKVRATNIHTGESTEYSSISECCRSLGISRERIRQLLKGFQNTVSNRKDKIKYTIEKI